MAESNLLWSLLFGSIGTGYLLFARQQRRILPFVCGTGLILLPMLLDNLLVLLPGCGLLLAMPWYWRD